MVATAARGQRGSHAVLLMSDSPTVGDDSDDGGLDFWDRADVYVRAGSGGPGLTSFRPISKVRARLSVLLLARGPALGVAFSMLPGERRGNQNTVCDGRRAASAAARSGTRR